MPVMLARLEALAVCCCCCCCCCCCMIRVPDSLGNTEFGADVKKFMEGAPGSNNDDDDERDGEAQDKNDGKLIILVMRSSADVRTAVEGAQQRG